MYEYHYNTSFEHIFQYIYNDTKLFETCTKLTGSTLTKEVAHRIENHVFVNTLI